MPRPLSRRLPRPVSGLARPLARLVRRPAALAAVPLLALVTGLAAAGPVTAGTAADYPEFPYPATTYDEPNRGQFHFSSRGGWMNDPNAPIYYRGEWHVFYQHNPHGLQWDTMHWGHATSPDLVHWTQRPIALEPGVHPGTLFSGNGVVDTRNVTGLKDGDDDPIVVFSNTDGVSVYYSTDGARTFKAWNGGAKTITKTVESRDPAVVWDPASKTYVMVLWSREASGNGVDLYRSTDLLHWEQTSRFDADWLFECPQLQQMTVPATGEKHWVLNDASGEYVVGDLVDGRFTTDQAAPKRINSAEGGAGGHYYAGLTFGNVPDGRTISMAWQGRNTGSVWTGNLTFPVEMTLADTASGPEIRSTPVREIANLRGTTRTWPGKSLQPKAVSTLLDGVRLDLADLETTIDVRNTTAKTVTFRLHTNPNGWSDRDVVYDVARQTLDGVPLPTRADGTVQIRMLVDRGQLEIFGNGGAYYRSLDVPFDSLPGGPGVQMTSDGKLALKGMRFTELQRAWLPGEVTFRTNITDPWYAVSGSWRDVTAGKEGSSPGDAFYLSTRTGSDFTYEGDVQVVEGTAAALTMRSSKDASSHYTVNIDVDGGVVKLWRPGRDIATYRVALERGRFYHLKVRAEGPHFQVWFDRSADPVIDATDDAIASGQFGVNMFRGTAVVQDVTVGPLG